MFRKLLLFLAQKKEQKKNEKPALIQRSKAHTFPRWKLVLITLFVVTIPLIFFNHFFALVALHSIAVLSRIYYRWFRFSIGIELGIFAITLTAISHGPVAGITIGVLHFLISRTITREPMNIVPICLLGYAAVGFFAGILPVTDIVFFGVLMTFIYDITTTPLFVGILQYNLPREIFFIITHLLFNYWVFSTFGEFGLKLVGVA